MTREELQATLHAQFTNATFDEGGEWLNMNAEPGTWKELTNTLRYTESLAFDYLFCLTCVDWKTHLTMVYHFTSTLHRHHLVVKIKLDRSKPEIASVAETWRTAEFHEREVFELFGVTFSGHPDLRRLILPDEWDGYPLRKDYEDPVNMIRL